MKKSAYKLESLFLTLSFILISTYGVAQDTKLSREEKKAARRDVQYHDFQTIDTMLMDKSFVLEANYLEDQWGLKVPVLSAINFIMVDSLRAVLQTGTRSTQGSNGVGGATAEGSISGLKIMKDEKHLSFYLRFTVTSNIGIYDVSMDIYSNRVARATITGLTRGKLVYDGRIESLYNSSVFKGRNSI